MPDEKSPAIPAATVVLLREKNQKVEILMLQKNTNIDFGGMWVFPGGAIDKEDYGTDGDKDTAAINAAVRETEEEAGLKLDSEGFVWFSHWTPPPSAPTRFSTWFFAAEAHPDAEIQVDGQEILKHRWINPAEAITLFDTKKIKIAPPTWMTLTLLNRFDTSEAILKHFNSTPPRIYNTRVIMSAEKVPTLLWTGDAAYENLERDAEGDRHRLTIAKSGFVFENTLDVY